MPRRLVIQWLDQSEEMLTCAFQLLDLCVLDYESVRFSYSLLAASALYLFGGKNIKIDEVTGFSKEQLRPCAEWMHHFGVVVSRKLVNHIREISADVESTDIHNIQTHRNALELLVSASISS